MANPFVSLESIMASQDLDPITRATVSPRRIRRLILSLLDSKSLRALSRVNRRFNEFTVVENPRMYQEIRFHLDLRAQTPLNLPEYIDALGQIGHWASRLVITFHNVGAIEFEPLHPEDPTRTNTLNPLPSQGRFDQHGAYSLVDQQVPITPGLFHDLSLEINQEGFFTKVFNRLPRLQALSIRANPSVKALWGRTLLDEALIYLRCQFEESDHVLNGFVRLNKLDLQLPTPLALYHLRSFPGYGDGGNPLLGREGAWSNVQSLSLTLPPASIAGSTERQTVMMKGIHSFMSGFNLTVTRLSIIGGTGNPLMYDLDPRLGGGLEPTRFRKLRELRIKDMQIRWLDLEKFLMDPMRGYSVSNLVLWGVQFVESNGWRQLYRYFELEHPERMSKPDTPLQLTRKLNLIETLK